MAPRRLLLSGGFALAEPAGARPGKPASFTVDYASPCTGKGGGPVAQPCHPTQAALSYAGKPLAADTDVTGSGAADLWIAADGPDANLFAYLEDVSPDGSVRVVTESPVFAADCARISASRAAALAGSSSQM